MHRKFNVFVGSLLLIAVTVLICLVVNAEGTAYTSTESGIWDDQSIWDMGDGTPGDDGFPAAGDSAIVAGTHTVTLDSPEQCTTLTVNASGVVTIGNYVFISTGDVIISGTMNGGNTSISIGSLTIMGTGIYSATTGTTTITSISGGGMTLDNDGSFTANNGTVLITTPTTAGLDLAGAGNLYDLTLNSGYLVTNKVSGPTIDNDFVIGSGTTFWSEAGVYFFTVGNDITLNGTWGFGSDRTLTLSVGNNLTVHNGGNFRLHKGTVSIAGDTLIEGDWGDNDDTGDDNHGSLTVTATGTYTATSGVTRCSGAVDLDTSCTFIHSSGTFNMSGSSLSPGGKVFNEITISSTTELNENVSAAVIWVNGSLDITAGTVLTFTFDNGFENSTGIINVSGAVDNLAYITGVVGWTVNASAMNASYWWVYVNVTNGTALGPTYLTLLGENNSCSGYWDFQAPIITSNYLRTGVHEITTPTNTTVSLNFTILDLSYIHTINITVRCTANNTVMYQENLTYLDFGIVSNYTYNHTLDISSWGNGNYSCMVNVSDMHNKVTKENEENAKKLVCYVNGVPTGFKQNKKTTDIEGDLVWFTDAGVGVYAFEFLGKTDPKHTVVWTDDLNFKLTHEAKTEEIIIVNDGIEYPRNGVRMRISGIGADYIPSSSYAGHFIFYDENGDISYFWDCQDFIDEGGEIMVGEKYEHAGLPSYTLDFFHEDWKKGEWVIIDPASGVINQNPDNYWNFTIVYEVSGDVDELLPLTIINHPRSFDWTPIVVIIVVVALLAALYSNKDDRKIRRK